MVEQLDSVEARQKVPPALRSCHTAVVNGYIVEGHVPAAVVKQLLRNQERIQGIAVAGMPAGSPGMESPAPVAYEVVAWTAAGETFTYATVAANGKVTYANRPGR